MRTKNNLTDMVYFAKCPACRGSHFVSKREHNIEVDGITYTDKLYYCELADAEFITDELAVSNLNRLRKLLKEKSSE